MEEEEQISAIPSRRQIGLRLPLPDADEDSEDTESQMPQRNERLIEELIQERRTIIGNDKLSNKEKLRLLEANRMTLAVASGTTVQLRKTENVVYAILLFGAVVLIVLALMNRFLNLATEVTLSFVGTVLGGTIATIAQKLGKL
jgi:hypothetical protein